METQESVVILEGPASFLDIVFETVEAHIQRTGEEYGEIITSVDAEDVGEVDREETAALHLYVLGEVDREEALDYVGLALDRIADEHNMGMARQGVQITFEEETEEL